MASRRITRHSLRDCEERFTPDGQVRAVCIGFALMEITRDAHGHIVLFEVLDRQRADENVRWRRHFVDKEAARAFVRD